MKRFKWNKKILALIIAGATLLTSIPAFAYGPYTMYTPPVSAPSYGVLSPRTIQLTNNGENNGKMYTTFEETSNGIPTFPIFESLDNGESWTKVGDVEDTQNGWGMMNCPQLFEMPETIGELTKGTLICVGNSCPSDKSATRMDMYKSTDFGRSWTFVSRIATGGENSIGTHSAIWEPFLLVANNKLICYISDERDTNYDQKLCHFTTTDGMNWSNPVNDVVWSDSKTRPGMPVVAKLSNGDYIMTFEVVGVSGIPCNYKISSDPENWDANDKGTTFAKGGSPYVTVLSDGRIIAGSYGSSDIYINSKNDGTGEWIRMGTPIGAAYNRQLLQLDNERLFIVNGGGFVSPKHNSIKYADMYVPSVTESYKIVNVNSGKVLGILGGSTADGAQAVQWTSNGSYDQMWQKIDIEDGYSKLFDVKTGKVLGVWQSSIADEANVVQWNDTNSHDQQWTFVKVGDYYKVVNRNSEKCLAVSENSTSDGAKIIQLSDDGSSNQLWNIVKN